ncbi:MAG TPA: hypothetical protein VFZ68_15940 [Acidimicrobiales bacterium]
MSILDTVTEAETKVVETVRNLHDPVVETVRKGVDKAEGRLPRFTYPEGLARPSEVVDSQYEFLTSLLAAQRDLVKAVLTSLSPLVEGVEGDGTTSTKARQGSKSKAA